MKLVQINSVCNGSTGKIMCSIADEAEKQGYETYNFFGRGKPKKNGRDIKIDSKIEVYFHVLLARLGFNGHGSYFATKRLIKKLRKINPDVIHMHNIHGYYINLKLLFKYLKNEYKGKIVWTLHDCWAFTGHCSHFTYIKCDKWKKCCYNCHQLSEYPKTFFDTSKREYNFKKKLFTGLKNVIIITPSTWLSEIVKKSFLKEYSVEVINNTVDTNIFKKYSVEDLDEIYKKYGIPRNNKIILGVAGVWTEKKGLFDFIELSNIIDCSEYQIVMVGTNDKIDKILPSSIISIHRTENQIELAKLYNIANVLFNPTYEDTYPTVNLESVACGTPVVTYNTGGSPESILGFGIITNKEELFSAYDRIFSQKFVLKKKKFNMYCSYLDLYK